MLLVVGYVVSLSAADSAIGEVMAYVPLMSPMTEPFRIAIGAGSLPEYIASIVILFASVVVAGRVGANVFRRAIVRTGRRIKLREVFTARDR